MLTNLQKSSGRLKFDNPAAVKRFNDLAREQMICRLLQDILIDLEICAIEGWDKLEYLNRLKAEINTLGNSRKC